MSASPVDRSAADRPCRKRRGWRRDQRGATAVEFALVALPFIFILFSITEVCVANAVSASLDNATNLAARQIMTVDEQGVDDQVRVLARWNNPGRSAAVA